MFCTVTRGVRIEVEPSYVKEESDPQRDSYFFAYRVRIENTGNTTVQLISRHWIITDAQGHTEEVQGPGVVGKTPQLKPGEQFEYVSFCPLPTPVGTMQGGYTMQTDEGEHFIAKIDPFTLAMPYALN